MILPDKICLGLTAVQVIFLSEVLGEAVIAQLMVEPSVVIFTNAAPLGAIAVYGVALVKVTTQNPIFSCAITA